MSSQGLISLNFWHINPCRLFNVKSSLYIWVVNVWLVDNIFKWASAICLHTVKWLYIWFVSQQFVGNLIFKWVRADLFTHS